MSESDRMPKVDFQKDKVHPYLIDQAKVAEKKNLERLATFKHRLYGGRVGMTLMVSFVVGVYTYTMYTVKQEHFLENFDEPSLDVDL